MGEMETARKRALANGALVVSGFEMGPE